MALTFLVPGKLDQLTGGYLFDRRVVEGLRTMGRAVDVVELEGRYADADDAAYAAAARALAALPDGSVAVIDGLALPAFAHCLQREARRLRLIGFIHHPLYLETGLRPETMSHYQALEARLWPLLRGVLCPSAHTAKAVTTVAAGAVIAAVTPPGTEQPAQSVTSIARGGPLRLLAVGAITARKGHSVLISALGGLRNYEWRLTCIGSEERDRATAAAVRASIAEHGLADRVSIVGERPPALLSAAYRDADLFVLPSYHEGYGMVYAEALAHGLPVIATTGGAIPDTVPADAGLLVPPGNTVALREALQRVFVDAGLRSHLAQAAVRAGAALPTWPDAVRQWMAALDRLAA